ncbi:MAG: zinc-binding dehydrogenase [Alphaproteobacteria bacterium]|nr:zinc-binding dehydrogenase [Alphaproteobacteria bacterium]
MRAAWHAEFGAAADVLQVGEFDTLQPGEGEVLVRVYASGINPLDVKKRAGARGALEVERAIPHYDGAGVIEAVGAGVDAGRIGERVWLFEGQFGRWLGTAAEYISLPSSRAVLLPDAVSFAEGACLGIPALTAHRAVRADGSVAGQTVLVTGAAGAVGSYAVQFAKLSGATVIGTVSSDEKAAQALANGAAHTINYKSEDVVARVKDLTDGAGVDRVVEVELGGNMPVTSRVIKANAVIAAYASMAVPEAPLPFYPMLRTGPKIEIVACFTVPEGDKMQGARDISAWMASDGLIHNVGATFDLDDIAAAHQAVESGSVIGGAVVEIG